MSKVTRWSWVLRNRFDSWLWTHVTNGNRFLTWLAPRLPWYLSDPEAHYWRKRMAKDPHFWDKLEPTTGPKGESPWVVRNTNMTIGATGSTINLEWRGYRGVPHD